MIYSVWRPERSVYDYYETAEQTVKTPDPGFLAGRAGGASALGVASTDAGWRLPSGARKVGEGKVARGMIATAGGGALGSIDIPGGGFTIAAGLGLLYLATRKRRRA